MAKNGLLAVGKGIAFATSLIYSSERRAQLAHWVREKAQWLAQKAHMIWLRTQAAFGVTGAAGRAGALQRVMSRGGGSGKLGDVAAGATDKATDAASKSQKIRSKPGGIGKTLRDVASGIKAFGNVKVLMGAGVLVAASIGLIALLPAIPTILLLSIPGIGIAFKANMQGVAAGLKAIGKPAVLAAAGMAAVVLAMFGVALIPLTFALSLLAPVIEAFGKIIIAVFEGMSMLVKAVAESFVLMFKTFAENWQVLIPVGLGLMALGAGLLALGAAAWFSFGGILLGAISLAAFALSLQMIQPIMEMGGLSALAEGLTSISQLADPLFQVGAAILGIGAGLGLMAYAGLAALPIIGALVGLAAVAPMLSSLGSLFGGGEGNTSEDDQMNTLIDEVRQLRAAFQSPGVINMDGQKVGDVLGLAVSNSGIS
jgi:hypothetical protein